MDGNQATSPESEPAEPSRRPWQEEMPFAVVDGEPVVDLPRDLYIPPDALEVFLEAFEGPLDLLLYLVKPPEPRHPRYPHRHGHEAVHGVHRSDEGAPARARRRIPCDGGNAGGDQVPPATAAPREHRRRGGPARRARASAARVRAVQAGGGAARRTAPDWTRHHRDTDRGALRSHRAPATQGRARRAPCGARRRARTARRRTATIRCGWSRCRSANACRWYWSIVQRAGFVEFTALFTPREGRQGVVVTLLSRCWSCFGNRSSISCRRSRSDRSTSGRRVVRRRENDPGRSGSARRSGAACRRAAGGGRRARRRCSRAGKMRRIGGRSGMRSPCSRSGGTVARWR